LSKLENHGDALPLQPFEPGQLLESVRHALVTQVEACGFELNLRSAETVPAGLTVKADVDAFAQIMINLVDNALKFAADAEPRRIDVGWIVDRGGGKNVLFYVRDYGPGIERGQRRKIFDLFYRSGDEMTRTKPGTGIGLALVKQLADRMGAVVDLVNRRPGVEFQLELPLRRG
jgi:two-component system, OmpR family, phosphate regulon sensor histidine kinase PhoR